MPESIETESLEAMAAQMGGRETLNRIIAMYVEKLPGEIESINSAAAEGDLESVAASAHRLKSSSGQLGAKRLAQLLAELEQAGRNTDRDAADHLVAQIEKEAEKVRADLTDFAN